MDWADKVSKLLRKAESTPFDEERDALITKAQHLMTVHAIDAAMIADREPAEREQIVQEDIVYTGIFQQALMDIGWAIIRENGCRGVFRTQAKGFGEPSAHILAVAGFRSDVSRVRMLDMSCQVQCAAAMQTWMKTTDLDWMSRSQKYRARRTFVVGFASGLRAKLREGRVAGEREAVEARAAAENIPEEQASAEVGIVLRSRDDQVADWMDEKYGTTLRGVARRWAGGGIGAHDAGWSAGRSADLGTSRLGGEGRRALGG